MNTKSPGRLKRICVALVLLDLLLLAVLGYYIWQEQRKPQTEALAREGDLDQIYAIQTGEALACVSLSSECTLTHGNIPLRVSNSKENQCAVALEIQELDSGNVIASTDLIDPGWYVELVPLKTELSAGQYQCLVYCIFYRMEDESYVGSAVRQLLLTVD